MPTSDIKKGPLYVDSTNNRVGVRTASPVAPFEVSTGGADFRIMLTNSSGLNEIRSTENDQTTYTTLRYDASQHIFETSNAERMRLHASGNLLVGTTSSTPGGGANTPGVALSSGSYGGLISATRDSGAVCDFNRKTNNGGIVQFRKDGSTVGSIGVGSNNDLYIGRTDTGLLFDNSDFILPWNTSTNAARDNAIDLGQSTTRFDDIHATNGTIQTSDANEKQQIAALTDAEITAAKAISALFKTFKWNDAVEVKGDDARTHAGVIAQDVEAAMTAAGLNAGDYAFFISSTWWETQTEVPAVEAVDAVLDEDGNVVTEAVEAVAAYTRTDTYETAEEAPEGATERNRKGIRYPELLAFVGAATEQRLANIETRLTALEAN